MLTGARPGTRWPRSAGNPQLVLAASPYVFDTQAERMTVI